MGAWEYGGMGEKSQILTSTFPYSCRLIFLDAYKRWPEKNTFISLVEVKPREMQKCGIY